jgi:polysaccharide export outer membrane protein
MEGSMKRRYSPGMTPTLRFLAVFCASLALLGQPAFAGEASSAVPLQPLFQMPVPSSSQFVNIGAGDQVMVDVFGMPDLRTTTAVAADGTIRLPLLEAGVKVSGMSPVEAGKVIGDAYKAGDILIAPTVTLTVLQSSSQKVSVIGEVRTPGRYPVETNTTVLDLLALAGGITEKGSDVVYILRPSESGTQELRLDTRNIVSTGATVPGSPLLPQGGDTIEVRKSVYLVNGEVAARGEFPLKGDVDLFQAIARAGGVTPLGSSSRIVIRRKNAEGKYIELKVDLKGKKNTRIEPDDVITVKERLF